MPGRADPEVPRAALIFALLIAFLPTRQAQEMEETELSAEMSGDMRNLEEEAMTPSTSAAVTTEIFTASMTSTVIDEDAGQLEFILMVLIPLIVLAVLLLSVILFVIYHKRKRNKQEPSSQGSQSALQTHHLGSENMKVPIFEEDTPSVMEIEMEELDKWMNSMNRNANYECLPTLEEEKEPNHSNPSDNES
ncbi:transmembrane protein 154 isoform X1 [Balaenoptera acutorostrata]|uniref:Transmembrane protein 154 isoform X1 n=1 Tax=Balaenoptera acutorostrata TaxID=9767 RepID=A0A384AQ20_BALAC|nr:transmembrane protein 154 isoform X1 [Balaenoptera acutorostrata]